MPQGLLIPEAALLSGLNAAKGGRRLRELRDKTMSTFSLMIAKVDLPQLFGVTLPLSLSAPTVVGLQGANFLAESDAGQMAIASKRIWDDGLGNYTTLYAMGPGILGNGIQITINAPAGAPVVTDVTPETATPGVAITPQVGNYAATLAAINTSKLIRAVQTGTGGTMAALAASYLTGGVGYGVRLLLADRILWDYTQYGVLFNGDGANTFVSFFDNSKIMVSVDSVLVAALLAWDPAGGVGAVLKFALEWQRPLCREEMPVAIVA